MTHNYAALSISKRHEDNKIQLMVPYFVFMGCMCKWIDFVGVAQSIELHRLV